MREENQSGITETVLASFDERQILSPECTVITFPGLEIRIQEQTVYQNGTAVPLSHYEFFTLCYLAKHPGWVFTRGQIYEAVWNEPGEYCNAAVSNVISQLRRKLWPENPRGGYIRTVHNSGYKFCPDSENN